MPVPAKDTSVRDRDSSLPVIDNDFVSEIDEKVVKIDNHGEPEFIRDVLPYF